MSSDCKLTTTFVHFIGVPRQATTTTSSAPPSEPNPPPVVVVDSTSSEALKSAPPIKVAKEQKRGVRKFLKFFS